MKTLKRFALVFLPLLGLAIISHAANVTLGWNQHPDLSVAGYNVYQGGTNHAYTNMTHVMGRTTTNAPVIGLSVGGTYFFNLTAFTTNGLESGLDGEVSYTVPLAPPIIVSGPIGSTNQSGSQQIFSVVATGSSLSYQWTKNAVNLAGQNGSSLTLNAVTWVDNGYYSVRVSNPSGSVSSAPALFAVIPLPPTGLTVGP